MKRSVGAGYVFTVAVLFMWAALFVYVIESALQSSHLLVRVLGVTFAVCALPTIIPFFTWVEAGAKRLRRPRRAP